TAAREKLQFQSYNYHNQGRSLWKTSGGTADRWLLDEALIHYCLQPLHPGNMELKVRDYWSTNQDWKWSKLRELLPGHILDKMCSMIMSDQVVVEDSIKWSFESSGCFSVKSAYKASTQSSTSVARTSGA
ncbi:hypothetical protein U1Q18_048264, partial [Sarracenia purpurea var. burkii]